MVIDNEQWIIDNPQTALPHYQLSTINSQLITTTTTTYDPLSRLTDTAYSDSTSLGYTYDAAGNRLTEWLNSTQVATYTYDAANRLTQHNGQSYTYDDNGNLLGDGNTSYTYDAANRLIGLSDGLSTVSYNYNGDGLRVAQTIDGLRTDYVQDIVRPLPQVLTARQGGSVSRYLRGLALIGEQHGGRGQRALCRRTRLAIPPP